MLIPLGQSAAHEIVGNRFFPATLGIDDPVVNDELALPTISSFKTGDDPSFRQLDFSGEFSKRITEASIDDPLGYTSLSMLYQRAGRIAEAEAAANQARVLEWKQQLKRS